jgi:hypothetical protein
VNQARVNAILFTGAEDHLINFGIAGRGDVCGDEVVRVANHRRRSRRREDSGSDAGEIGDEKKGE